MKTTVKYIALLFYSIFLLYLSVPNTNFPAPPPDAIQSSEPADIETPLRRAYFTDLTREEVIKHYSLNFSNGLLKNIQFAQLRLNYPPEESQTIIRDQTRSTFLEELAYPLRESFYINGFEPKDPKDDIWYEGRHFRQKVTVRYIPSGYERLIVGFLIGVLILLLYKQYSSEIRLWQK